MSYILDALRRAESERGRGEVPGLHAQPEPVGLGEGAGARLPRPLWMAAGGVAFALVLVLFGWWLNRPPAGPAPAVAGAAPGAARPDATGATSPAPSPATPPSPGALAPPSTAPNPAGSPGAMRAAATPPASNMAAAAAGGGGPPLLVAPPAPPPAPSQTPRPAPRPAAATAATTAAAANATAPAAAAGEEAGGPAPPSPSSLPAALPAVAAPARPAAGKPTPLADLPAGQRAELPQLLIGGAIYSDQPASRFVVINGLVVREGETAAPGVVLERIAPKSAVIRWREMKIEVPI